MRVLDPPHALHPLFEAVQLLVAKWNPPHLPPRAVVAAQGLHASGMAALSTPFHLPKGIARVDLSGAYLRGLGLGDASDAQLRCCDLRGCDTAGGRVAVDGRFSLRQRVAAKAMPLWPMLQAPTWAGWPGHSGRVNRLAASADGRFLASVGEDGAVWLWRLLDDGTAQALRHDLSERERLLDVVLSDNGQVLAAMGANHVHIWLIDDTAAWKGSRQTVAVESPRAMALSGDGTALAVARADGSMGWWEFNAGRLMNETSQRLGAGQVSTLAFLAGALLGGSEEERFAWSKPVTGSGLRDTALARFAGGQPISRLRLGSHNGLLASAAQDGAVRLWQVDGGVPIELQVLVASGRLSWDVATGDMADGRDWAAAAGDDGVIQCWLIDSNGRAAAPSRVQAHQGAVRALAASGPRRLHSAGDDGAICHWLVAPDGTLRLVARQTSAVLKTRSAMDFTLAGLLIGAEGAAGVSLLRTTPAGRASITALPVGINEAVAVLAASPDGAYLAIVGTAGHLWLSRAMADGSWAPASLTSAKLGAAAALVWSPDSSGFVTTTVFYGLQHWRLQADGSLQSPDTLSIGNEVPHAMAWSVDGLLAVSTERALHVWRSENESLLPVPGSPFVTSRPQHSLVFMPEGLYVMAGDADGGLRLWSAVSGSLLSPVNLSKLHEEAVCALAISRDARFVASAGMDGKLCLSTLDSRMQVTRTQTLSKSASMVFNIAFSPDGQLLAALDTQGHLSLWARPGATASDWERTWLSIGHGLAFVEPDRIDAWRIVREDGQAWDTQFTEHGEFPADAVLHEWLWFSDARFGAVPAFEVPPAWLQWADGRRMLIVSREAFSAESLRAGLATIEA